jgi:hypothetical protein
MPNDNNVFTVDASNNSPEKNKPNPFDPKSLRIAPGSALSNMSIKKNTTIIPVKKPSREMYVRTSPNPEHTIDLLILELKDENEVYVVKPELQELLENEVTISVKTLVVTKTRQSIIILWPLKSPTSTGRACNWAISNWDAATKAKNKWTRMIANQNLGAYEIYTAESSVIPEPTWEDLPSMQEMLEIAFKGKFIDSYDHPVLKKLRGEI